MRLLALFAAFLMSMSASSAGLAGPGEGNADAFYNDAKALLAKGAGAMFDKRLKPTMAQLKVAGEAVRAENAAATNRGRPLYCVPEKARQKGLGPKFVVDQFGTIPQQRRRQLTVTQAWREILVREYPCR